MARMKEFLMSLAATTVSIILTFGTTAIIDRSNYQSKVMMKVTNDQLEVFSKENPSGRLSMTIPLHYEDDPTYGDIPEILADKAFNYSFYRRNLGDDFRKRYEIPGIDYVNYDEGVYKVMAATNASKPLCKYKLKIREGSFTPAGNLFSTDKLFIE